MAEDTKTKTDKAAEKVAAEKAAAEAVLAAEKAAVEAAEQAAAEAAAPKVNTIVMSDTPIPLEPKASVRLSARTIAEQQRGRESLY